MIKQLKKERDCLARDKRKLKLELKGLDHVRQETLIIYSGVNFLTLRCVQNG